MSTSVGNEEHRTANWNISLIIYRLQDAKGITIVMSSEFINGRKLRNNTSAQSVIHGSVLL